MHGNGTHLLTLAVLRVVCLLQDLVDLEVEVLDQPCLPQPRPLLNGGEGGGEDGLQCRGGVRHKGDTGGRGGGEVTVV